MIKKIKNFLKRNFSISKLRFLFYIKKINSDQSIDKRIILIEFNDIYDYVIPNYFFLKNYCKQKKDIKLVLITSSINKIFKNFMGYLIFSKLGLHKVIFKKNNNQKKFNIKNKNQLFNLTIDGINIGKDIYEDYMMTAKSETVDFDNSNIQSFVDTKISKYYEYKEIIKKNKIDSIIVFQDIYESNILCKLAYKNNIPVIINNVSNSNVLKKPYQAYEIWKKYKFNFSKLKNKNKKLLKAKNEIEKRKKGYISDLFWYSKKSSFKVSKNKFERNMFNKNKKIRILICTHCFYDNPHPFEQSSFKDFREWIEFLILIEKKTPHYDWKIKVHNDFLPGTLEILNDILKKKKSNMEILPTDISHHEIVKSGVTHVTTCYGTVGFDYAFLNIPVINFNYNPRINYKFNLHAENSKKKYKKILLNLNNINIKIKNKEVYENYFMHYMNNKNIHLFFNHNKIKKKNFFDDNLYYEHFLNNISLKKEKKYNEFYKKFINNNF